MQMQTETMEKVAGIGALGLWAALHGWMGWLVVLYAVSAMMDYVTGTALAIKEKTWSSSKARQGLWHKGGSIIIIGVSVLTDILLGLTINYCSDFLRSSFDSRFRLLSCRRNDRLARKQSGHFFLIELHCDLCKEFLTPNIQSGCVAYKRNHILFCLIIVYSGEAIV